MRYQKAPVSEVILGLTYATRALALSHIFLSYKDLSPKYPVIEIMPPIADESMVDFRILNEVDAEKTGEFLLRLRSADRKWLIQLQGNKVLINWIRLDVEDVGNYVGFTAIRTRLGEVLAILADVAKVDLSTNVKYLEVTYHDRIEWQKYIPNISEANAILRMTPPKIGIPTGFNNLFSRYTYPEDRVGGYGSLSMNTATSVKGAQLLKFENTLRGLLPNHTPESWVTLAHEIQFEQFESIFSDVMLKEWK